MTEFYRFPKIARLFKPMVITEKIDGTNGQIYFDEITGEMRVGCRTRWITAEYDDNHGFAKWVLENEQELRDTLGPGRHFGEWWGQGINRGYGMKRKVFSLFNTKRWEDLYLCGGTLRCVPVLCEDTFSISSIYDTLERLRVDGSIAEPGYMNPEGIVVYHAGANQCFKVPFDPVPKGEERDA